MNSLSLKKMKEDEELLQFAKKNNLIDFEQLQKQIVEMKRKEYLEKHNHKIWKNENDKKWYTYLDDETKTRKIKLIKRNTREDIENLIIEYYKNKEKKQYYSFKDVYFMYRNFHDNLISDNSIAKYETDYKRFFENTEFEKTDIKKIDKEIIILFVVKKIKELELIETAAAKFYQYLKATIRYALEKELIIKNPCEFISFKNDFKRHCKVKQKKNQIVSDENMKLLKMQLELDHAKMENYIPAYAVEFAMLTGMRVGEISALKWECINFKEEYILIYESEKSNRKKNVFHLDDTKNSKIRTFPITTEIKELLLRIQKVQKQFNKECKFVFENEEGRIHAKTISACSQTKCRQLKIDATGIHKYRKTLNSKMRCANVSNVITSELLGNTRQVNEEHYTFDTTDNQFKKKMLEAII